MADDKKYETNAADMKEIRDEFADASTEWKPIRDERKEDMRHVAGDPWDPEARTKRKDAGRPIITADELGQYVNQIINGVRVNKRAIRVTPEAMGADQKTADYRQNRIRQIEYKSNAQQGAYTSMFENTVQGSYGFLRVKAAYENHRSFNQELRIEPIPNPDLVTPDPYSIMPDGSDWKFLYLSESWAKKDFKRKWPKAKAQDFTSAEIAACDGRWSLTGDRITVAERWCIKTKPRTLLLMQPPPGPDGQQARPLTGFADDPKFLATLPPGSQKLKDRPVDYPYVYQEITNGLEILEHNDWPGTSIPFVACYGKVLYVDMGKGPERKILSAIRLARDPYMLYCYYRTQQAEMAAQIPKTPIGGYKGQFAGNEDDWQKLPHEPLAFIEYNHTTEGWNASWGPMPIPQRIAIDQASHLQALELCAEGARRAIQAAMGISPLPTQAQRHNEKSGKALQQIEDAGQKGSFHFVDHYDAAITRTGAILDELIPTYDDTAREVTVRKPDDSAIQVHINDPNNPEAVDATTGVHDVTISVGPAFNDEREAASNFADMIIGSPLLQLLEPPKAQQLVALSIKLKAVGPIGDEMADVISPPKGDEQGPTPEQIAQMQAQIQELTKQLQAAAMQIQTDSAKQQAQIEVAKINAAKEITLQTMKNAATIRAAEITATKETVHEAMEDQTEAIALHMEQGHEALQNALDRQHQLGMGAAQAATDAAAQDRSHQQTLEQGAQGADLSMQQAEHAQAIAPPEAAGA